MQTTKKPVENRMTLPVVSHPMRAGGQNQETRNSKLRKKGILSKIS